MGETMMEKLVAAVANEADRDPQIFIQQNEAERLLRAVLETLREPDEEMMEACFDAVEAAMRVMDPERFGDVTPWREQAKKRPDEMEQMTDLMKVPFQAMIDHILNQPQVKR